MTPFLQILAINLLPVLGVAFFGWSALTLVLVYWLENLVIGALNAAKILVSGFSTGRAAAGLSLFLAPFFVVHYGMFCFVHGLFILALFGNGLDSSSAFDVAGLAHAVMDRLRTEPAMLWSTAALAAFHLYALLRYWVGEQRWRTSDPLSQMFAPYSRILVVHLTIMLAGIAVMLLGQPMLAVLCLALLKTGLESGRARLFDAYVQNTALSIETRRRLRMLDDHAWH
jgi:hypothetical protein